MTTVATRATLSDGAAISLSRIRSIDIVRGVVMVLMAIDHVRVYSGVPAGGPTAGLFFTRWVTHFCAPAFVFFAGTAAFLHGRSVGDPRALARYLATRGVILVALELTVIHLSWTFTLDFSYQLAGVIWMLGWCMVLLAALVRLPARVIGATGLIVIFAQQLFGLVPQSLPAGLRDATMWFWQFLYVGGEVGAGDGGVTFSVLYSIVPWIGVMMAGYGFGTMVARPAHERDRLCVRIGLTAIALFLVAGSTLVLVRPSDDGAPFVFRLLNQNKYRDSQLFLLMTLGPTIALLPLAERVHGWFADVFAVFGRVPLFYYLLHIPLIHALSLLVWFLRDGSAGADRFATAPYVFMEDGWWSLPLLYTVFAISVFLLYWPCRWYAAMKTRRASPWLRFL